MSNKGIKSSLHFIKFITLSLRAICCEILIPNKFVKLTLFVSCSQIRLSLALLLLNNTF